MSDRTYINVPYEEKEEAKAKGAYWDNDARLWYYKNTNSPSKFEKWAFPKPFMGYNDLSNEQQAMIDRAKNGENILVDACIGSGKTTAIQVLCNELLGKSILYLTYNTLLKVDAKAKIQMPNVTVTNYHGFAYMCLAKAQISVGTSDMIQTVITEKPPIPKKYDVLILDEYQDIEEEIAKMLIMIKDTNPNMQIIAVGDMKQKIYDKTTLEVPKFIDMFLGKHTVLNFTKCFRLCEELATRLGKIWEKQINGVNEDCKVMEMSLSDAIDLIAVQDVKDILCLGSRNGDMVTALNLLEKNFPEKFNKNTVFASIKERDDTAPLPSSENAVFTTYDSSKGMERKYCYVFDFTEDYWDIRSSQSSTKYTILRNVFCVAASRGKERVIFVNNKSKANVMLTDEVLAKPFETNFDYKHPFDPSEMFSFKYKEDVDRCFSLIKKKKIDRPDTSCIDTPHNDGLIDLSPCVGIWQEASFFEDYDIDSEIEFTQDAHPDRPRVYIPEDEDLDYKILALTTMMTGYDRYMTQVERPFIDDELKAEIHDRLKTVFDGYEKVQHECFMDFESETCKVYHIDGRCDVMKNGLIYELKFVEELEHEHFLQLAIYLVACHKERGILWNVKKNEMFEVTIPNRKKFMSAVIRCITKGSVTKFYMDSKFLSDTFSGISF